ncbi:hypothetical protein PI124_g12152 [Phytophthora idaei]|nr:hypothetical protein PI125_g10841 [Phytophthora idaei]KAG3166292.1 hypothetical protein PI126_g4265 [Phytophthora idaei]KAG3243017.1 hypothetical protein PI124_g12152 [Phytophthora idaei]
MAKSKRTGRELQLRLASLKHTYGKQLSNFPSCFFGGSSPTQPSLSGRGRSGGRRQGQSITKLGGAGSRGGGDSCGISQSGIGSERDSYGGTGRINARHVGHGHDMDGLGVVGPVSIPSLGKEGVLEAMALLPVVAPSTVVMLVVLVRIDKASAALTTTEIVIAKPAAVTLIKAKLSPSEVASVVLGSTVLGKTDPAAMDEDLATLGKIEQTSLPEQRRYVLTSKRHRQ